MTQQGDNGYGNTAGGPNDAYEQRDKLWNEINEKMKHIQQEANHNEDLAKQCQETAALWRKLAQQEEAERIKYLKLRDEANERIKKLETELTAKLKEIRINGVAQNNEGINNKDNYNGQNIHRSPNSGSIYNDYNNNNNNNNGNKRNYGDYPYDVNESKNDNSWYNNNNNNKPRKNNYGYDNYSREYKNNNNNNNNNNNFKQLASGPLMKAPPDLCMYGCVVTANNRGGAYIKKPRLMELADMEWGYKHNNKQGRQGSLTGFGRQTCLKILDRGLNGIIIGNILFNARHLTECNGKCCSSASWGCNARVGDVIHYDMNLRNIKADNSYLWTPAGMYFIDSRNGQQTDFKLWWFVCQACERKVKK